MLLRSIEITGFRGLNHLRIAKLGHVNLFVGRNGVGKTSLLEAIALYLDQGNPGRLVDLLTDREEYFTGLDISNGYVDEYALAYSSLFHRAMENLDTDRTIRIGSLKSRGAELYIKLVYLTSDRSEDDQTVQLRPVSQGELGRNIEVIPGFHIQYGDKINYVPLDRMTRYASHSERVRSSLPRIRRLYTWWISPASFFVRSGGLTRDMTERLWDTLSLTEEEDTVIQILRVVNPRLERLALVEAPINTTPRGAFSQLATRDGGRIVLAKLAGEPSPVPIKRLGGGATKILDIALTLVNARNGSLLVDEIENGIHYSILGNVFKAMFSACKRLDVQVFATTHSYDCIAAFAEVASLDKNIIGVLNRIDIDKGKLKAVDFSEHELQIAAKQRIEVR